MSLNNLTTTEFFPLKNKGLFFQMLNQGFLEKIGCFSMFFLGIAFFTEGFTQGDLMGLISIFSFLGLFFTAFLLLVYGRRIRFGRLFAFFSFFLLFIMIHAILTYICMGGFFQTSPWLEGYRYGNAMTFFRFIFYSCSFFSIAYIMQHNYKLKLFSLAIGLVIGSIFLVNQISFFETRMISLHKNPNYLALSCGVSSLIIFGSYKMASSKMIKVFFIPFVCFLGLVLLQTLSRGAALALCVSLIYLLLTSKGTCFKKIFVLLLVILLGYILAFFFLSEDFIDAFAWRFSIDGAIEIEASGIGRSDIWRTYLTYPNSLTFLIGEGLDFEREAIRGNSQLRSLFSSHNNFIKFLVELGVFGLSLFSTTLFFLYKKLFALKKDFKNTFLPSFLVALLSFLVISGFFSTNVFTKEFFVVFGLVFGYLEARE